LAYCAYCGSHVAQVSFVPCASCGNPTNGAPSRPTAAAAGGTNTAVLVIAIAAAALVVFAIIGILAAIAIPNLLTAMQRSRQKRTMADMRTLATALEAYGTDHEGEEYPPGEYAAALAPHLQPKYLKALPGVDGWGTGVRYSPLPNRGYVIRSAGGDKTFEHDSPDEYARGATQNFDCDIVFSNGEFLQYPEGVQSGGGQ
jgi:type II secretory pathway pseudopilin PulG